MPDLCRRQPQPTSPTPDRENPEMPMHRVTTKHIGYLASGPTRTGGSRGTALVDTDAGIRLVSPDQVLAAPGVRRLLLTRVDLAEDAAAAGKTLSEYVKSDGGRIAAELNALLAEPNPRTESPR